MGMIGNTKRSLLQIWVESARSLLPGWLVLPGAVAKWTKQITITDLPASEEELSFALRDVSRGALIDIVLSENAHLPIDSKLPAAAISRSEQALQTQIVEHTPLPLTEILHTSRLVSKTRRNATYRQYLVRKSHLGELVAQLQERGFEIRNVLCIDEDHEIHLQSISASADRAVGFWWGFAGLALVAVFVGWVFSTNEEAARLKGFVTNKSQIVAKLREQLATHGQSEQDRLLVEERQDSIISLFERDAFRVGLLNTLSDALPDTVWLSELAITGPKASMRGFSTGDVTQLITTLESLAGVKSVTMTAPIVLDQRTNEQRFELMLELLGEGA